MISSSPSIIDLSKKKNEPDWMLEFRLKAYEEYSKMDNPDFGPELNIDFDKILYYKNEYKKNANNWDDVDTNVRNTFCKLGVVDAEQKYLDGVTNQFESEVVYHSNNSKEGVIFTSTDDALQKYHELFKKYFNHLVKYQE